jgi:hypothetical protein
MLEAGVPVALGTDFNPNAFCLSMVSEEGEGIFERWRKEKKRRKEKEKGESQV